MNRTTIPVEVAFRKWDKNSEFQAAYNALEEEFALASVLIGACPHADEQVVERKLRNAVADEPL